MEITTIITSIVNLIVSIVLACLTGRYVGLTNQMLAEMKSAHDPSVYVDLEFADTLGHISVGNSSDVAAYNIQIKVVSDVAWLRFPLAGTKGLSSISPFKSGISFLGPKRILKYVGGILQLEALKDNSADLVLSVTFEDEAKRSFTREYRIDGRQFDGILFSTYRDPALEVAKAIRDAEQQRQWSEATTHMTRLGVTCPTCGEMINPSAKKCKHCLEFVHRNTSNEDNKNVHASNEQT